MDQKWIARMDQMPFKMTFGLLSLHLKMVI